MNVRIMFTNFYLTLLLLSLIGCNAEKEILHDVVILNGNVIDLETGQISKMDIGISDSKIKSLSATKLNSPLLGEVTIDAANKFILPGFWDNHVHFRGGDSLITANKNFLKLFLANGITTVRDAGGDLTNAVLAWNKAIDNGTLDGPTIFTSGPKIDGPGATWAGSLEVENESDISEALDSLQKIPVDFVKLYDSRISGEQYLNTIKEAEKRKMITSGHMPFTVTLNETIDAGIDGIEHLYYLMKGASSNEIAITQQLINKEIGFWDAMPLLQSSYDTLTANTTFSTLKKNNVFVVPTLHIGHTLSYLDEDDHSADDYLKYMSSGIQKTYQGRINRVKNAGAEAVSDRKELDRFFGKLAYTLNKSGVSLLAGSDSGAYNSYTYPGISLHKEMEALENTGMTALEALRTSAYNGSQFLKKDIDYGSISINKVADLVILDQNPLEDITNTKKIATVLKQGKVYTKQMLDSLLQSAVIQN